MQLVAIGPIIVTEEQGQSGLIPVLVEAVSETNSDARTFMRIAIRIEDTNPSSKGNFYSEKMAMVILVSEGSNSTSDAESQ